MLSSNFSLKYLNLFFNSLILAACLYISSNYELKAAVIDCPHGRESMLAGKELAPGQICGHAANSTNINANLKVLVVSPDGCCDQELVSREHISLNKFKPSYYTSRYNPEAAY